MFARHSKKASSVLTHDGLWQSNVLKIIITRQYANSVPMHVAHKKDAPTIRGQFMWLPSLGEQPFHCSKWWYSFLPFCVCVSLKCWVAKMSSLLFAIYWKKNRTSSLCSINYQNWKLRLDFVEIWSFYWHSVFYKKSLANSNSPKM